MTDDLRSTSRARPKARLNSVFGHIEHREKRAFLRRYAETGKKRTAALDAGVHPDTPYSPGWRNDPDFQEALEVARLMAGDLLEEEMMRRGVEGVPRVQFNKRTGEPLRDPLHCALCGSHRDEHARTAEGEPGPYPNRDCAGFAPGIYVEHEYSDRLLEQLARSHLPERYMDRLHVRSFAANLDMTALPDVAVARIADGEDVHAVLVSVIAQGGEDADMVKRALPSTLQGEGTPSKAGPR